MDIEKVAFCMGRKFKPPTKLKHTPLSKVKLKKIESGTTEFNPKNRIIKKED